MSAKVIPFRQPQNSPKVVEQAKQDKRKPVEVVQVLRRAA